MDKGWGWLGKRGVGDDAPATPISPKERRQRGESESQSSGNESQPVPPNRAFLRGAVGRGKNREEKGL